MSDDPCPHYWARAGIVTNQPSEYDKDRPHASVAVCGDTTCRARALAWVWQNTREQGVYVSDKATRLPST
jgi:hypothetical protein